MPSRRSYLLVALALGSLTTLGSPAWAQLASKKEPELTAIILTPLDADVAQRIEGQTADLPWRTTLADTPGTPGAPTRLQQARALATAHTARAVLWVEHEPEGLVLRLFDPGAQRLLTRRFRHTGTTHSAAIEALAVALRASLQALAEGDAIGDPIAPDALDARAADADVRSPPQTTEPVASPAAPSPASLRGDATATAPAPSSGPSSSGLGLGVHAGASLIVDGATRGGLWGAWVAPRITLGALGLALRAEHTWNGPVRDPQGQLTLARRGIWALVDWSVGMTGLTALRPGLGVGLLQHLRHTRRVAPGLVGTPDQQSASVALELGLALDVSLVRAADATIGVSARAAGQALLSPPVLRYDGDSEASDHALWMLVPSLSLSLWLRTPQPTRP